MNTAVTAPPAPPAASTARVPWVDALRVLALGLLIVYHVGMYYVPWDWHVKSAQTVPALAPSMWAIGPWRMTLVFVVAGMALALHIARAPERGQGAPGTRGLLRERAARLLLPLLCGVVLVVPPQAYFEVRQFHGFAGSGLEFLRLYFGGAAGLCTPARGCLILPTWNHLWFLPYLFVYTALLLLLLRQWPQALDAAAAALGRLAPWAWLLLPLGWFALTRMLLAPRFGVTHALVDDVFAHAQYAFAFGLGAALGTALGTTVGTTLGMTLGTSAGSGDRAGLGTTCRAHLVGLRRVALALALASWAIVVLAPAGLARQLAWSSVQWCAVLAALGFGCRHLDHDRPWLRALVPAVFTVYVLHQTITIVAAVQLAPFALPPLLEAPLLLALTFGLGALGYLVIRRMPFLRPWFGLPPVRRRRALGTAAATPAAPL